MAGKAGSITSIVLGTALIAIGIVGLYAGGSGVFSIIAGVSLIAGGAVGLAFTPKTTNRDTVRANELQIATAADGVPLPVIFGEQRVVGNWMNYTADNFRSVKVVGRSDGSKGGDQAPANIIGFDYFLSWEYGICMGPVDEIIQVFSSPGEQKMMGEDAIAVVYADGEHTKEINLDSLDPTSSSGAESGLVRVYRGSATQDRLVSSDPYNFATILTTGTVKKGYRYRIETHSAVNFTAFGAADNNVGTSFIATASSGSVLTVSDSVTEYTGLNYRHICWALFMDFLIGRFPQPKSYHFVIRRFPEHDTDYHMLRPDGTPITGFKVRGSGDIAFPGYYQANPAAIMYECLTNKVWGRGLDQDLFDEATWIAESQYFYARNIGMSFTLDTADKIFSVLDGVRAPLKTVTPWDGQFLKLRCLLNLATTHGAIQTITKADVISFSCVRPLWQATSNEIRAEFQNRSKNYRPDSVHVRDLGNRQMTDRSSPERITLSGFIDFNTVRRQAFRILREKAYPLANYSFEVNRFHSQLEVGDVFKLWWDEYDGDTTAYCLVVRIEDSDSDTDRIKITAVEDITLTPTSGSESTPSIPSQSPWEKIADIDEFDVQLWDGATATIPNDDKPAAVIELPPVLGYRIYGPTRAEGAIMFLGEQPSPLYNGVYVYVSTPSQTTARLLSHTPHRFSIAGTLNADFTNVDYTDRTLTGFTFSLFDSAKDEADLLSLFSIVDTWQQSLEDMLNVAGPFVVIRDEILQIGKVDKIGSNSYRARNIVRGRFGSRIRLQESGERVFFVSDLGGVIPLNADAGNTLSGNGLGSVVRFQAVATANNAANNLPYEANDIFYLFHSGERFVTGEDHNQRYRRESDTPIAPSLFDISDGTTVWDVRLRPRYRNLGAGTIGAFLTEFAQKSTSLASLTYRVFINEASGSWQTEIFPAVTLIPGDTNDPESGLVLIQIPKTYVRTFGGGPQTLTTTIATFTAVDGARESLDSITVKVI